MKFKIIVFFILGLTIFSCRKSNYHPAIISTPQDSLLSWKLIDSIPGTFLSDIWFTSALRGFIVADKMYQTTDGGKSWTGIANTSGTGGFYNLFFVNSQYGFAQSQFQLATTTNGGDSWNVKTLPTTGGLTIFFTEAAEGFYGDENSGLMKTSDSGNNWVNVFSTAKASDEYYPYFLDPDTGYVATGSGTLASTTNGGQTWESRVNKLPVNLLSRAYNQLFFLDRHIGFYACPLGVLKTIDGGDSWQSVLAGTVDADNGVNVIRFVDANTGYYKASSVIYKSSDGGQTWSINCKLGTDNFVGMYFLDSHTGWACTARGRVLKIQQ